MRFFNKQNNPAQGFKWNRNVGYELLAQGRCFKELNATVNNNLKIFWFFFFLEETDWCYRMNKTGWKVYHVPQAEIIHFQGKSAEVDKKRSKVEYYRSRYHFFKKNRGRAQWSILLIGQVIKLLVEMIYRTVICSLTLFTIERETKRLSRVAYLLSWHLRGCPEGMGLKPAK